MWSDLIHFTARICLEKKSKNHGSENMQKKKKKTAANLQEELQVPFGS